MSLDFGRQGRAELRELQESFGGMLITARLDQDVERDAVLVDGSPQPVAMATPDHDAKAVQQSIGAVPLAGLFCNGEIGPVGARTFVHGFTASLALIAPGA